MPDRGFLQRLFGGFRRAPAVGAPATAAAERLDRPHVEAPPTRPAAPQVVVRPPHSAALEAFVATVRQLPLFSTTAIQVMRSVGDDTTGVGELVRLISTDAGLVVHLLRIVNSPYYGLPQRISTVGDAVAVLGFDQVRRTVSASVLKRPLMSYVHDTAAARTFLRHELLTAALAREVALSHGADGEVAYMAGLLHEIGRLAMLIENPELGDLLLRVSDDQDSLGIDREIGHFGFDHAAAGGALLEHWGLPAPIVQAAYDHGAEEMPSNPVSLAVWHANLVAHHWIDAKTSNSEDPPWLVALGLSPDVRETLLAELAALEESQP